MFKEIKKRPASLEYCSAGLGRRHSWNGVKGDRAKYYGHIRNEDVIFGQWEDTEFC